jgi:hypothetical protein
MDREHITHLGDTTMPKSIAWLDYDTQTQSQYIIQPNSIGYRS